MLRSAAEEGAAALERINAEMGLAFDDWDLRYYREMFAERLGRNPTDVELFDIAQSNSEHSRHWFFKGNIVIDGEAQEKNLMRLVRAHGKHVHHPPLELVQLGQRADTEEGDEQLPAVPRSRKRDGGGGGGSSSREAASPCANSCQRRQQCQHIPGVPRPVLHVH